MLWYFFFFQAEDGIRDLVRSRGLGDVYKRQDTIIKNHIIWSMGAGLIPVPIVDFFAVSGIQLDMIRQLCKLYDQDFKESEGKAIITSLTGSGLARMGAKAMIKFIPGIGSVLSLIHISEPTRPY